MYTYWVEYTYQYTINHGTEVFEESDSGRFHCRKKDIKKEVEKEILDNFLQDDIHNLKINIYDYYITTDEEI